VRLAGALAVLLLLAAPAAAQDAVPKARALLAAWHEEPARLGLARALLETAVAARPEPDALVELARVCFLMGDFQARSEAERVASYERGAAAARRAIAGAPQSDQAHLWYAINTGRLAELRGVMRAAGLLSTIREESETVLKLNPSSVDGLILAGGIAAEVPALLGGDKTRAETLFKKALETDPHQTGGRLELARLYVNTRRWQDAQRELQRVIDERSPSDVSRWTLNDRPKARAMLTDLYQRGRVPAPAASGGAAPESP
jgi:tetratricopeptide (TPR) repeat protein